MPRVRNNEQFIEKANKVHNNNYKYLDPYKKALLKLK